MQMVRTGLFLLLALAGSSAHEPPKGELVVERYESPWLVVLTARPKDNPQETPSEIPVIYFASSIDAAMGEAGEKTGKRIIEAGGVFTVERAERILPSTIAENVGLGRFCNRTHLPLTRELPIWVGIVVKHPQDAETNSAPRAGVFALEASSREDASHQVLQLFKGWTGRIEIGSVWPIPKEMEERLNWEVCEMPIQQFGSNFKHLMAPPIFLAAFYCDYPHRAIQTTGKSSYTEAIITRV